MVLEFPALTDDELVWLTSCHFQEYLAKMPLSTLSIGHFETFLVKMKHSGTYWEDAKIGIDVCCFEFDKGNASVALQTWNKLQTFYLSEIWDTIVLEVFLLQKFWEMPTCSVQKHIVCFMDPFLFQLSLCFQPQKQTISPAIIHLFILDVVVFGLRWFLFSMVGWVDIIVLIFRIMLISKSSHWSRLKSIWISFFFFKIVSLLP